MRVQACGILAPAQIDGDTRVVTFPSVCVRADGVLLATCRYGVSKDGADERVEILRSDDGGRSWNAHAGLPDAPRIGDSQGTLKLCYLTEIEPGLLLAAAMWVDRTRHPGQPLFNPVTQGCLPMAIVLARSRDGGLSWSDWQRVDLPGELGPPSLTAPVMVLADGSLAISIETNKSYEDAGPWRQRAVFVHSADGGQTWSPPVTVAEDPSGRVFNWDLRCAVAPDGRIASFAWTYDTITGVYRNIHRRISADGGASWTAPEDLGFADQPGRPAMLKDGRVVLAWVDRFGTPSMRVRIAERLDGTFAPQSEVVLYAHPEKGSGAGGDVGAALDEMHLWTFGLPSVVALPDGDVLVTYYAPDAGGTSVFWARLRP